MKSAVDTIFEGIDIFKFKSGTDIRKVVNIVIWTLQGFTNEIMTKEKISPSNKVDYD